MAKDRGRKAENVAPQSEADNKTALPEAGFKTPSSSSQPTALPEAGFKTPSSSSQQAVSSAGPGSEASALLIAQDRMRRMSLDQEHPMALSDTMESDNGVRPGSKTSQDPALDAFRAMQKAALKFPSWSDEVEEDEEFKNSEFFGRNMYGLLAEGASAPVAAPQAPRKKYVKPDCVASINKIPDSHKSPKFFLTITKPFKESRHRGTTTEPFTAFNRGVHGEKNIHTTFIIDGGKVATPSLKVNIVLSIDPAKKIPSDGQDTIHVSATLPCGDVTTAHGNQPAFLDNGFHFAEPNQHPINMPDEVQTYFRKPSDKTPNQFLDRVFAMRWKTGGAVVLRNFNHPIVKRILASSDGAGYHEEAANNLKTLQQFATRGSQVDVLWTPAGTKEISLATTSLKCVQWSVEKGLFFFWPYADENGRFTGDVEHIARVGGGFLDRTKAKAESIESVQQFYTFELEYPIPNLTSYLISVAVAEVRELEQAKITRDGLRSETHRAWIVASSPLQLAEDFTPSNSDWYMVYIQITAGDADMKNLTPKPAEVIRLQWLHSEKGSFEAKNLRWKGPVIELQNDREMGLCHFVMFAEAQRDSVRPTTYSSIQNALRGSPNGLRVSIEVDCRTTLTRRAVAALQRLFRPQYLRLALTMMGKQDEADKVPLDETRRPFPFKNADWRDQTDADKTEYSEWLGWLNETNRSAGWNLNTSQLQSIKDLAKPQYLSATQGPPGTGKSKTGAAAIAAAVKAGLKVLCVASSNAATDNIAGAIRNNKPSDLKMKIVRAHVPAAEWHATTAETQEVERRGETSERVRNVTATFEMTTLAGTTKEDMEKLNKIASQVHERHFVEYDLSMSQAVLLKAYQTETFNLEIPEPERTSSDHLSLQHAQKYLQLQKTFKGQAVPDEFSVAFDSSYRFLTRMVLVDTDVVVTTCYNAVAPYLSNNFKPDIIFHDESGQSPDFETLLTAAAYPTSNNTVFLGDQEQLEPTVISVGRNEFAKARKFPVMARLQDQIAVRFLDTQYRMSPAISKYPNFTIYDGRIKDAHSVQSEDPTTRTVKTYFHQKIFKETKPLAKTSEVLFADLPNSQAWRSQKDQSRENWVEARFLADHTVGMLKFKDGQTSISATDISIIVMYKAQRIVIRDMLLQALTPEEVDQIDLVTLEISTVDAFQGRQNKIIFLSWVVGGVNQKDPAVSAFFKDAHRLCVAISRAQYGFLMAGNFRGLLAAVDPKNPGNFIRQNTRPPKLFELLTMIKQEDDLFRYPESEYRDTAPQRLQQEEERRGEQLQQDLLSVADAQNEQNRNKRRFNQSFAANKRSRGGGPRGGRGGGGRGTAA